METDALQFIYLLMAIILNIITVIGSAKHAEARMEKRLTRIEVFVKQCCKELGIHTDELNSP